MLLKAWLRETRARWTLRRRLAMLAQTFALPSPQIRFSRTPSPFRYDCRIDRGSGRYVITFMGDRFGFLVRYNRTPAALFWLSHCPPAVSSILVNMSDGDAKSCAPFAYSVDRPGIVALPDNSFFSSHGFSGMRSFAERSHVRWQDRSSRVRWRGTTNGLGGKDYDSPDAMWDQRIMPRIRMLMILRNAKDIDAAFAKVHGADLRGRLQRDGMMREKIPETDWINDRIAIDIDGTTNTWTNLMARWHLGCCVIKVDSQGGFRQWYYDRIRPWEHFVPVRSDMGDLVEKIEWARSNDAQAREIAANGQSFARSMTLETETRHAVAAICAAQNVVQAG